MKLKTTALLGAAALALMAGSASAGDLACLITKNNTNPFFVKMKEGAEKAAAEAGLDFQAYAGEKDGDAAPQITAIENCVAAGAKGILITPSNDSVGPALKDARAAGILVIALDTPLADTEAQDITFATDNCLAGEAIGQWAAGWLNGEKATIAELVIFDDRVVSVDYCRANGFLKGMGIEVPTLEDMTSPAGTGSYTTGAVTLGKGEQKLKDIPQSVSRVMNDIVDPEHRLMIATIRDSGEMLLRVLNDILDLSKIDAGRLELEATAFCPSDVVAKVEALHSLRAQEKGLSFAILASADAQRRRIGDPHRIGAKGADAHGAEFGVAAHDGVLRAPFQIVEAGGVDEIDLAFEGRGEAVIPVLQGGHDRHVVGLQLIQARAEHIGQLAFVDEHRRLPLANGQFGAVFDGIVAPFKPPDHRVAGVIGPIDDIDEFALEETEHHSILLAAWAAAVSL